jgi:hypothetical protein
MKFKTGLLALLFAAQAWAGVPVQPDDAQLQYTGRIDFADRARPMLSWPGTSIEGNFTGATLAVKLDDQLGKNFFNVFIDGDYAGRWSSRRNRAARPIPWLPA